MIITGICNCSYLVLQIGAIFAPFMQRNMPEVKGGDRASGFMGKVKSTIVAAGVGGGVPQPSQRSVFKEMSWVHRHVLLLPSDFSSE